MWLFRSWQRGALLQDEVIDLAAEDRHDLPDLRPHLHVDHRRPASPIGAASCATTSFGSAQSAGRLLSGIAPRADRMRRTIVRETPGLVDDHLDWQPGGDCGAAVVGRADVGVDPLQESRRSFIQ